MRKMETENQEPDAIKKDWYKSKAMLSAVAMIGLGAIHYYKTGDVLKTAELFTMGMAVIGIRMAKRSV